MRKAKEGIEKQKKYKVFFIGISVCVILAIIIILMQAAIKKRDHAVENKGVSEGTAKLQPGNGKKEETSEARKNSMERYLEVVDPEKRTKDYGTEAARYSRQMSADEESRYQDFLNRYEEDGLAPKEEIEIVDKMEDYGKEVDSPIYAIWEVEFFLPERTLTDEELLQIVDFGYKVNDALEQKNKEIREAAENSSDQMTEQEAVDKASDVLEKMFGVDTSAMEKEVQFNGIDDYHVLIEEKMMVFIEVSTGAVIWIVSDGSYVPSMEDAMEVDKDFEKLYYSNYEEVKTFLCSILDSDAEIVSSSCRYKTDQTGSKIPEGTIGYIDYYFKMADGSVYQINYDIVEKRMDRLTREDKEYTSYKTKEELEKEETKKIGDKFVVPLTGAEKEAYGEEDTQWIVVPME